MEDFAKPIEWLYTQHVCNAIQMYLAGQVDIDYYHNVIKDHSHHTLPQSVRQSDVREYILEFLTCFEQAHKQKEEITYKERYQFMVQGISQLELASQSADELPASNSNEAKEILKKLIDKVSARTVIASSENIAESRVLYKRYKHKMTSPQQHACECVLKGLLPADKWLKSNTKYAEGIKELVKKFMLLCPSTFLEKIVEKMDNHSKKKCRMTKSMKQQDFMGENGATSSAEVSEELRSVENRSKLKGGERNAMRSSSDEITSIQITNVKSMAPPESVTKHVPPNANQENEVISDSDSDGSKPGTARASDVTSKYFTPEVNSGLQPLKDVSSHPSRNVTSSPKAMPPPLFHTNAKPEVPSPSRTKIGKERLPTASSKFPKIPIQFRKVNNALNQSIITTSTAYSSRTRHTFTTLQDAYIIMGVRAFGRRWLDICRKYPFPEYRTPTHLKDRWRTLCRRGDVEIEDGNIVASDKYEAILTHVYRTMEDRQSTGNSNLQPNRSKNASPAGTFDIDDLSDDDHETTSKRKTVLDWLNNKSNASPTRDTTPAPVEKDIPQTSGAAIVVSDDESLPSIHGLSRRSTEPEYVENANGKLLPNGRSRVSSNLSTQNAREESASSKTKRNPSLNTDDLTRVASQEDKIVEPSSRASKISNASSGSTRQSEIAETPDLEVPDSGAENSSSKNGCGRISNQSKLGDGLDRDIGVRENRASPEQAIGSLSNQESTPVKSNQSSESAASMSAELFKITEGSIHLELLPESEISFSSETSSGDNSGVTRKPFEDNVKACDDLPACGSAQFFTAPDSPGSRLELRASTSESVSPASSAYLTANEDTESVFSETEDVSGDCRDATVQEPLAAPDLPDKQTTDCGDMSAEAVPSAPKPKSTQELLEALDSGQSVSADNIETGGETSLPVLTSTPIEPVDDTENMQQTPSAEKSPISGGDLESSSNVAKESSAEKRKPTPRKYSFRNVRRRRTSSHELQPVANSGTVRKRPTSKSPACENMSSSPQIQDDKPQPRVSQEPVVDDNKGTGKRTLPYLTRSTASAGNRSSEEADLNGPSKYLRKRRLYDAPGVPVKMSKDDVKLFDDAPKKLDPASFASGDRRRQSSRKKWTADEDDNLLAGVTLFGDGMWKSILERFRFENRTAVNLKDRYRVLKYK